MTFSTKKNHRQARRPYTLSNSKRTPPCRRNVSPLVNQPRSRVLSRRHLSVMAPGRGFYKLLSIPCLGRLVDICKKGEKNRRAHILDRNFNANTRVESSEVCWLCTIHTVKFEYVIFPRLPFEVRIETSAGWSSWYHINMHRTQFTREGDFLPSFPRDALIPRVYAVDKRDPTACTNSLKRRGKYIRPHL